jgi:hypothetical protein
MPSRTTFHRPALAALALALVASGASAQAAPAGPPALPAIGEMAPDFSLPGATRYGRLSSPVKLSDFRGKTVVIAFFYQARTKG